MIDIKTLSILVVDDEPEITGLFKEYLNELGYKVHTAISAKAAQNIFNEQPIDLVLLDINMPRVSGLKLLELFKHHKPDVIVIMVSAIQDIDMVVKCIHMGAYDYLVKPIFDLTQLKIRIQRTLSERQTKLENLTLRKELAYQGGIPEIRSHSVAMKKVLEKIHTVAQYDTTILLSGESGTGKEVAARTIHNNSHRSSNSFIAVNCGSIPNSLIESTLFGHERGAFTDATKRKIGLFEDSNYGTIFLDEITETTPEFQIRLLRVLESNHIRRIGGNQEIKLDLRIIAATNQDIDRLVEEGSFREDLYYRLNVFHITLPPLRERREDIPVIADFHLDRLIKIMGKEKVRFSATVLELFNQFEWKGNIRELINVIENALIVCKGDEITLNNLPNRLNRGHGEKTVTAIDESYTQTKENFDRQYFSNLLQNMNGNISKAAKTAGLSRQHFHLKIKKLGINQ